MIAGPLRRVAALVAMALATGALTAGASYVAVEGWPRGDDHCEALDRAERAEWQRAARDGSAIEHAVVVDTGHGRLAVVRATVAGTPVDATYAVDPAGGLTPLDTDAEHVTPALATGDPLPDQRGDGFARAAACLPPPTTPGTG